MANIGCGSVVFGHRYSADIWCVISVCDVACYSNSERHEVYLIGPLSANDVFGLVEHVGNSSRHETKPKQMSPPTQLTHIVLRKVIPLYLMCLQLAYLLRCPILITEGIAYRAVGLRMDASLRYETV